MYLSLKKPNSSVYLLSSNLYLLMYLYKSLTLSKQKPIENIPIINVTSTRVILIIVKFQKLQKKEFSLFRKFFAQFSLFNYMIYIKRCISQGLSVSNNIFFKDLNYFICSVIWRCFSLTSVN